MKIRNVSLFHMFQSCWHTTFSRDGQIYAASEAYNSIKVDKTRYNSMRGSVDVVTLHRQTDPKTKLTINY